MAAAAPLFSLAGDGSSAVHLDEEMMRRALALAAGSVGLASPNPHVGCVLARDGILLGEGAHHYDALNHAEIVALRQLAAIGASSSGATAYVTLEPCSHWGRTGPCAEALIRATVVRVVVATGDPNPQVSGRGIARLRAAGIAVEAGLLEREARALNDGFAHFIRTGRPFVTLKAALSIDGRLAPAPSTRSAQQPFWLTGRAARADVQRMRHGADAILTGVGTVLADDPLLTDRTGSPRRRPLLRVVVDGALRTPLESQLVRSCDADVLVFCAKEAQPTRVEALEAAGVEVEMAPAQDGRVDLGFVLDRLGRRNVLNLMVEAGSAVNGSLLSQGLVGKVVLYYAETELGVGAVEFAAGIGSPYLLEQGLRRVERVGFAHGTGEDVRVSGYLYDPWVL